MPDLFCFGKIKKANRDWLAGAGSSIAIVPNITGIELYAISSLPAKGVSCKRTTVTHLT